MRILVICQRYWPEQFQVTDICEGLAARGHDVTVLCGLPNVGLPESEGRVLSEYKHGSNRVQECNGVHVVRTIEVGRRTGVAWRTMNYYSFWKAADRKVLTLGDFDVCLAYQLSPAMMCDPARVLKERRGVPYLLYCCDLWPESMKAMLGEKGAPIVEYFGRVCRKFYSAADRIAVESPSFEGYFSGYHGIPEDRLTYIPQFSTDGADPVLEPHDGVNFFFLGNMGTVQCVPFLLEAFKRAYETEPGLGMRLHFVGDGVAQDAAKKFVCENDLGVAVLFHGRHPVAEMPRFYAQADACVMALDDSTLIGSTIPSKLQGYMAAGKPVVAAVRGGARFVINESECGYAVDPGDVEGFADTLLKIARDAHLREECGANARTYFEKHFTKEAFLGAVEHELASIAKGTKHGC